MRLREGFSRREAVGGFACQVAGGDVSLVQNSVRGAVCAGLEAGRFVKFPEVSLAVGVQRLDGADGPVQREKRESERCDITR